MQNKLELINKLFEGKNIRVVWDAEAQEYFFSVIDVIEILTESLDPAHYWRTLKSRMTLEGNETVTNCVAFKMKAKDGKMRITDTLDTKGILRLIQSIPSPKAEPFKLWLASLGKEEIDNIFDPSVAINKSINYYKKKGYTDSWIEARLKGILNRNKLTSAWKETGIREGIEYAILTNEIYKSWSGMKTQEYKEFKSLKKESLKDNVTDIEVSLADLGEISTRELIKKKNPRGLEENKEIAKTGGSISRTARDALEKELGESVIKNTNNIKYEKLKGDEK